MSVHRTHVTLPAAALLRHACTQCGGCCQGVRIPIYNDDERALVERAASHLHVDHPMDGKALRMVQGRCVFLDERNACRIHAELGADAKPIPCRQFPLIAVQAEDGVRIGIDPASYGAWRSWRDGAPLPDGPAVATKTPVAGGQLGVERHLVIMCEDSEVSIAGLLAVLTREPAERGVLPHGFAHRWATRLSQTDLAGFLAHEGVGRRLRGALQPVADAAPSWGVGAPPWPALHPDSEAWAVEAVRRVLYLRLLPGIPNVSAAALLLLGGVVAAAWTDPTPERFHDSLTGWLRALRFDVFWRAVARDKQTMVWLGTGSERT